MVRRRVLLVAALAFLAPACRQNFEKQRWNHVYSSPEPFFNTNPNSFLVEVVRNRRPGQALDLGMGQGRNALFLAQQGWDVTGVDISDVGLERAREQAGKMGVKLHAVLRDADDFDFGKDRWDLVALIYFPPRPYVRRIRDSLKTGGIVVVECFHRETAKKRRIGAGVVFDSNELPKLFKDFHILRYEEASAPADWLPPKEREGSRVVRLLAQKM